MEFFIADWAVWTPTATTDAEIAPATNLPELAQVPAMTRRRLSPLTKITFDVALATLPPNQPQISAIFSSRHGDLHKTLGLLQQVATQEALSPGQFALSVHNAISGQLSLFLQNQADSNAISAGADSLHYAILEAAARLQVEPELQQILVIYADEPVPHPYQAYCQDPSQAIALALLLDRNQGSRIRFSRDTAPGQQASEQQATQLLPLLQHKTPQLTIDGLHCRWIWQQG